MRELVGERPAVGRLARVDGGGPRPHLAAVCGREGDGAARSVAAPAAPIASVAVLLDQRGEQRRKPGPLGGQDAARFDMGGERGIRAAPALVSRKRRLAREKLRLAFLYIPQAPGARSGLLRSPVLFDFPQAPGARSGLLRSPVLFVPGCEVGPIVAGVGGVGVGGAVPSPLLGRGERDEACAVFVPCPP